MTMSTGPQALRLPTPGELAPQTKLGRFLLGVHSVARLTRNKGYGNG
jgi:hypothetical protein